MPATATLFLNRNSGARGESDAVVAAAREAGVEIVELSQEIDCAHEVRERACRGTKLFIAAGGDGTVHHVVQGLANTDAALAVIPLGTYNHFARDLGIPLDWREALDVALHGATRAVDIARISDRFFVNNVSIGLYPELVARREEHGRDYPRWRARLHAFYRTMRKYPHVTLTVESNAQQELVRTHVFMISNNSYELERFGIEAPRMTLTEGKLSVYWLEHMPRLRLARLVARYLTGRVRHIPSFRSFRTTQLRIQSKHALRVGIDGELLVLATPLVVTIVPQGLTVKVPDDDAERRRPAG